MPLLANAKTEIVIRLTVHHKSSDLGQCDYAAPSKYWAFFFNVKCPSSYLNCPVWAIIDEFLVHIPHVR